MQPDLAHLFRSGFTEGVAWNEPDRRELGRAHTTFLESGELATGVRSVVAESWRRSQTAGISAEHGLAPITLDRPDLLEYRDEHRLSRVFPLLYDILGRIAEDCGYVMALGDELGQLLWVCGEPGVLRKAETIHFAEGTAWNEERAGTNAPGTALRLDAPVVIRAAEHWGRQIHPWSCAAAPIHDPITRSILGILDITGKDDVATPQTLGMVRTAARMAEVELARIAAVEAAQPRRVTARLRRGSDPAGRIDPTLQVQALGRPDCTLRIAGRTIRLSPRHSEILVLLMAARDGVTGDQLALQVYPEDTRSSTVRAELARLRTLLGTDVLESRPYRLSSPAVGDWQLVDELLATGQLREALTDYRGPLLPYSEAPGVQELREGVHHRIRAALLASDDADLLAAWTRTRWGADDLVMWRQQAALLPVGSPLRSLVRGEIDRLDARFRVSSPRR